MGTKGRRQVSEIIERLAEKSTSFSFVQAVRLLLQDLSMETSDESVPLSHKEILENYIRVRPELSLSFPGTDITRVETSPHNPSQFLITATFLGLYGASSPLPTFYTEDLIAELNEDKSIKRDFLDIINHVIYPLFFKIWSKHRLFYKICEENDDTIINMIYCLLGLENKAQQNKIHHIEKYFRYAGLTLQFPRSAEGLASIIEDCLNLKDQVKINQCVQRKVPIPKDQYAFLGKSSCTLGEDCVIGTKVLDISGKFQVVIESADQWVLHAFLPDQPLFMELKQMVDFYVNQPLEWELVMKTGDNEVETAQPGNNQWSRLGWNTWLVSENSRLNASTVCFH